MIDHERARELAALSLDATLEPTDAAWLEGHLAACEACSADVGWQEPSPSPSSATGPSAPRRIRLGRLDRAAARAWLRRPAFLATVAVVAVAIVAGGLAWGPGRPTAAAVADASHPARSATPGGSAGPEPSGEADPWSSLDPSAALEKMTGESVAPTAMLTARGASGAVVPLDTGFRLASVDATPASELAARLTVEPKFVFAIAPEAGDRAALITPSEPLRPGTVYRFDLHGAAGQPLDSWAFQARQPLRVVGTLPDDQATDVPLDTGIEVTFDQDGVTDAGSHFSVKPATPGRFEQHDRTLAFVPDHTLTPATIYTVTVSPGVSVKSTGEASDKATTFRFETAAGSEPSSAVTFQFQDQVLESATGDRPIVGLWWFSEEKVAPKTLRVDVYRLADLEAGVAAFRSLRTMPDWSRWSNEGLIPTTSLSKVLSVDARINKDRDAYWLQLPDALPAGWYLVQHSTGTRPNQAILQVTDVAGYLIVSDTKTTVWANDLRTGKPIVGATAAAGGTDIARTDRNGLAIGPTPKSLFAAPDGACLVTCESVVTVRTADGRSVFLPAALPQDKGFSGGYSDADRQFWALLHSDRSRYRPTDTINAWGVLRDRDSGKVPPVVTLQLKAQTWDDSFVRPAVGSVTATPGPTGTFMASLPLSGLADGYYSIELLVGGRVVRTSGIEVGAIAKPAYRLEIETGRRVYVAGDRIKITVRAKFFEGTPVSGVPLRIGGLVERDVTTDATGTAVHRTTAKVEADQSMFETSVGVAPARAEEGEITGQSRELVVFPSSRMVDVAGQIAKGRVQASGSVHLVAIDRLESQLANGKSIWELDPRGAAVGGATVTLRFWELIPVRKPLGTRYDFIEKRAVETFDVSIVRRAAGTIKVKTARNGSFSASIPAAVKGHDYTVTVTVADRAGHVATSDGFLSAGTSYTAEPEASLGPSGQSDGSETFGIGDRVDLTMTDTTTRQAAGDGTRYLFVTAQRGIREATVQASPRFRTTYREWAAPNLAIGAVRFTGHGYAGMATFIARFRTSDRQIKVELTVAAARYAPGETATVKVRTTSASGAPLPATVVLRTVDEKLYAIGAAQADDPLTELYAFVSSGILGTYGSHRTPRSGDGGGGGDTTGGGGDDRDDFRDALLFKTIVTDANGRGSVAFRLSDDLTSWRVTGAAITSRLDAGFGSVLVPVGLPFFVDASIAPEYLVGDRPSIVVRAFGSALAPGDAVTIQVTSKSLGFDSGPIRTKASETTAVALPALRLGPHDLTIAGTTGSGSGVLTDRLTRPFTVVGTRLTQARTAYVELPATAPFGGGDGLTSVVVSDAGAGRYLATLAELASGGGARLDRGLAAEIATSLLVSRFGSSTATGEPSDGTFDARRYQTPDGGLALLPYSSVDLELSALVAIVAPDRIDRNHLGSYLHSVLRDASETRERHVLALAGLAGLGDSVLPALQAAAADRELTIREQLMVALGAAALGDVATARSIASTLIAAHGERLGEQARLRVGTTSADITAATALLAVIAAAVGDNRAPLFWAYVEANPAADRLEVLPAVAYVTHRLDRQAVQPASFAYTVDGVRTEVALENGRSFALSLTSAQLASLKVDRISGSVGVTTSWRASINASAIQADPDVTIRRVVQPAAAVASSDLLRIDLIVTFGPQAARGCHEVTELVPSGLTPVGSLAIWLDPDADPEPDGVVMPYEQSGARVSFCAVPTARRQYATLRYYARVVTPGTYAWEPALAASRSQAGQGSVTSPGEVVIR
jgi:hypothetical protein